jgi:D-3-phosphoglycerate dehydrogenase / 2-oxoglutarate reductase
MKVLIIDEMHLSIIPLLEKEGFVVDYRPEIKREEIMDIVHEYEGLIIRSKTPMDKPLLQKANKLRFIGRAGAGLDKIDLEYLKERGIHLFHAAEGNKDAVGEQAIGMLLSFFNHIGKADQEVRKGIWNPGRKQGGGTSGQNRGHHWLWQYGFGNGQKTDLDSMSGFWLMTNSKKVLGMNPWKKPISNPSFQNQM